jgi:phage FluMu protein Com
MTLGAHRSAIERPCGGSERDSAQGAPVMLRLVSNVVRDGSQRPTQDTGTRARLVVAFIGIAAFVAAGLLVQAGVVDVTAYLSIATGALAFYFGAAFLPSSTHLRTERRYSATRIPATPLVPIAGRRPRRAAAEKKARECRCSCGRLLARATSQGIEVKCGRCGRVLTIAWPDGTVLERPNPPAPESSSKSDPDS